MPVRLPVKTHAKLRTARPPIAAFEVTSVLIGTAAVSLTSFVYWGCHDQTGAALVLLSAATILALLTRSVSKANND